MRRTAMVFTPPIPALTAMAPGAGFGLGSYPSLGMNMRFSVSIDGLDLGHWSACKGLNVKLGFKRIEQGGDYTHRPAVPERIEYQPVTLERAVNRRDSFVLQVWLQAYISQWNSIYRPPLTSVVIRLLDYQLKDVMQWRLNEAFPSAWNGPTLSATDSKVAIESLVLEHDGFFRS